jgi:hypothetical protein
MTISSLYENITFAFGVVWVPKSALVNPTQFGKCYSPPAVGAASAVSLVIVSVRLGGKDITESGNLLYEEERTEVVDWLRVHGWTVAAATSADDLMATPATGKSQPVWVPRSRKACSSKVACADRRAVLEPIVGRLKVRSYRPHNKPAQTPTGAKPPGEVPAAARNCQPRCALIGQVKDLFRRHPDPAVHPDDLSIHVGVGHQFDDHGGQLFGAAQAVWEQHGLAQLRLECF